MFCSLSVNHCSFSIFLLKLSLCESTLPLGLYRSTAPIHNSLALIISIPISLAPIISKMHAVALNIKTFPIPPNNPHFSQHNKIWPQKLVKAKKTKMEWYPSVTIERKWHHSTVYRNMLGFVWSVCQCVVPKGVPRTTVLSWWMPLSSGYWLGLSRVLLGSKFGSLGQDPTDFFLSFFFCFFYFF